MPASERCRLNTILPPDVRVQKNLLNYIAASAALIEFMSIELHVIKVLVLHARIGRFAVAGASLAAVMEAWQANPVLPARHGACLRSRHNIGTQVQFSRLISTHQLPPAW